MDAEHVEELRRFFAALADEERLAVAGAVAARPGSVQELAARLRVKDADIARHLGMLHALGIVTSRQEGSLQVWSLNVGELRALRKRLLARDRAPSPADVEGTPEWERLVLRNFFDGERLKEIPVNQKKKLVVITWLAEQFEWDRQYTEREVNAIIQRHHPDSSTLRRELIDRRFMQREHGVYWRIGERPGEG